MGEKDALGGGGDLMSKTGLSPKWEALIRRLWEPDGKSIVGFLPEIVATIKSTKSSRIAEHGLLMVFQSPKVRDNEPRIKGFSNVRPGYQELKPYCDAAGLPLGKIRATAIAIINALSKEFALSEEQVMALLDLVSQDQSGREVTQVRGDAGPARRASRGWKTGRGVSAAGEAGAQETGYLTQGRPAKENRTKIALRLSYYAASG